MASASPDSSSVRPGSTTTCARGWILQQKLLSVSAVISESMTSNASPAVLLERALAPILSAQGWVGAVAWIPNHSGVLHQACSVGRIDPVDTLALAQRIDLIRHRAHDHHDARPTRRA